MFDHLEAEINPSESKRCLKSWILFGYVLVTVDESWHLSTVRKIIFLESECILRNQ